MHARVSERATTAYYSAALHALRFLEAAQRSTRRFGVDADARWSAFHGDLTTADRIDLLIRDANAEWPEAFGARTVFAMRAVAEDEPFGSAFTSLDPVDAEELWRTHHAAPPPSKLTSLLNLVAGAWELRLAPHETGAIGAADKLVLAGPSAITAAIAAFEDRADLDWSDQVVVVATPPAHRQLAALGGALLRTNKPTRILTTAEGSIARGARLIASADADPADVERARELAP